MIYYVKLATYPLVIHIVIQLSDLDCEGYPYPPLALYSIGVTLGRG